MRARLPRLHKDWRRITFALAPSSGELRGMVRTLRNTFGETTTADLLGVSVLTLRDWTNGRWRPCGASPKAIWLVHALLLRPETVRSAFDLVTWGRFSPFDDRSLDSFLRVDCEDWSV